MFPSIRRGGVRRVTPRVNAEVPIKEIPNMGRHMVESIDQERRNYSRDYDFMGLPNHKYTPTELGAALFEANYNNRTGNSNKSKHSSMVMIPIPISVDAYKKYKNGGKVTIEELFGY